MSDLSVIQIGMHGDPAAGGADRYFWDLNEALPRETAPLKLHTFFFGTHQHSSENTAVHCTLGPPDSPLIRRLRSIRQGVLSVPGFKARRCVLASHFALYALPLLPELASTRHVVHFHGPWAEESAQEAQTRFKVAAKTGVERLVFRSAARFITLSAAFRDLLISTYGVTPAKVSVVPGGVDLTRFRPGPKSAARDLLGWPLTRRILFCVRRLASRMGLSELLTGFSAISARHPDVLLMIAGKGPLQQALQAQITALGVQERVRLLGFVADSALPLAYQAADLSIVPSRTLEGFGLTTLESLACGTPVLVTPVDGLPEVVRPLSPSCVLSGAGSEHIASGLDHAFSGKLALPSGTACAGYVQQGFAWPRIARQVRTVYEEVAMEMA